jgi:hypothetical protein
MLDGGVGCARGLRGFARATPAVQHAPIWEAPWMGPR